MLQWFENTAGGAVTLAVCCWKWNHANKETVYKLQNPNIRRFKKRKVRSSFTDNVYGVDFADMEVLSKFDKENALKEKIQQLLTLFKKFKMNLNATQIKCW